MGYACALGREPDVTDITQVDRVVAEALARKHAAKREQLAEQAEQVMRARYTVERDTWAVMTGALLAQVLEEAGSIRKAAKHLSVPRATLGAWVKRHREQGHMGRVS